MALGALAPAAATAGIALRNVAKSFGRTRAVDDVSAEIAPGEFFVVLGPSGCGKSTLLRLIAGLETLDGGSIALGGGMVAGTGRHVPPEAREVAVVFQSYALWPHMSVAKNVAFPAEAAGLRGDAARAVVDGALKAVALEPYAARRPAALSGGQQQRVALARCLASRAGTVLMDEPLANLDPHLRHTMEGELSAFHARSRATTLYITHDQREAMALATRIAVMDAGRFIQVAPPRTLYDRPASEKVASFIGRAAVLDGEVTAEHAGSCVVRVAGETVEMDGSGSGPSRVVVRPHQVRLGEGPFTGSVSACVYRGGLFDVTLEAPGFPPLAAEARTPVSGEVLFAITGGWVLP